MKEANVHIIIHHLSTWVEASVAQRAHSSAEQRAGTCSATAAAAAGSAVAFCTVCFIDAPPVCHDPLFLSLHFSLGHPFGRTATHRCLPHRVQRPSRRMLGPALCLQHSSHHPDVDNCVASRSNR